MASSIPASVPAEVIAAVTEPAGGGAGARRTRRLVAAGLGFVLALTFVAINLLVDLLYGVLDPRIRRE